jgi:epsilon-lactone hydrolase
MRPWFEAALKLYPIDVVEGQMGGVRVRTLTPVQGIRAGHKDKLLINIHGGGFTVGAGYAALDEAMPAASLGGYKVITVDYRLAPEHPFPAAVDDTLAVYREALKTYRPQNIGVFGCSAGGVLTAELIARLQKEKLPNPGAIGILCAGAGQITGDSIYTSAAEMGRAPQPVNAPMRSQYWVNVADDDPLAYPMSSDAVMAGFPPTFIEAATRGLELSSAVAAHGALVRNGVHAELNVWDGLPHGFFTNPAFTESKDLYMRLTDFFDRELGGAKRRQGR